MNTTYTYLIAQITNDASRSSPIHGGVGERRPTGVGCAPRSTNGGHMLHIIHRLPPSRSLLGTMIRRWTDIVLSTYIFPSLCKAEKSCAYVAIGLIAGHYATIQVSAGLPPY